MEIEDISGVESEWPRVDSNIEDVVRETFAVMSPEDLAGITSIVWNPEADTAQVFTGSGRCEVSSWWTEMDAIDRAGYLIHERVHVDRQDGDDFAANSVRYAFLNAHGRAAILGSKHSVPISDPGPYSLVDDGDGHWLAWHDGGESVFMGRGSITYE